MGNLDDDYAALRRSAGAVWLDRDVLLVAGPDAERFLQGQLSQDVAALGTGESSLSFLLQPQGKVDALLRVTRTGDDSFLLDTDGGFGEAVATRLQRFMLRVKLEITPVPWRCLAVRGPDAHARTPAPAPPGHRLAADWPGLPGVDLLGPDPVVPEGVPACDPAAFEVVRIEAGIPRMGPEMGEQTIPAETGLVDRSVSFTKGCSTGQELVARIDSRGGNVPRRLRGVRLAGDGQPPAGAVLEHDGKEVGRLTSVARAPAGAVALAYVRREVEPPVDATVRWEGGQAEARVEPLPLVP